MITKAEEPKGRWVVLFWVVIVVVGYFWVLPRLNGTWEVIPAPDAIKSSSSPPSEAKKKTQWRVFDLDRYADVVPIGEPSEAEKKTRSQLFDPGRYADVVPIGEPTEEPPKRPIR